MLLSNRCHYTWHVRRAKSETEMSDTDPMTSVPARAPSTASASRRENSLRTGLSTDRDYGDWRILGSCRNVESSLFFSPEGSAAATGRGAKRTPNASARTVGCSSNAASTPWPLPNRTERGVGCPRPTADGAHTGVGDEMHGPAPSAYSDNRRRPPSRRGQLPPSGCRALTHGFSPTRTTT